MKSSSPAKIIGAFFLLGLLASTLWFYFSSHEQKQSVASVVTRFVPALRPVLLQQSTGTLQSELQKAGFALGQPVLLRLYKQESELEIWMMRNATFEYFKTFPICKWSGQLGPKLREGDGQSPEGFYEISSKQLNPNSRYHLAMNIGFPNAFDASESRTGSAIMIHGSCVSIGCYAMTDAGIEDIYKLVEKALTNQQSSIPIHIFPFRMTSENLAAQAQNPFITFWENLAEGDAIFQRTKRAVQASACGGRYYFENPPAQCEKVRAW